MRKSNFTSLDRKTIQERLILVVRDIFDDDEIDYSDDLSAADIEAWDSLTNIRLMVAVEKAFGVRFSNVEWLGLTKLGDLVDLLGR